MGLNQRRWLKSGGCWEPVFICSFVSGHEALWTLTQLAVNPSCNSQHPVWLVHSNKSWNEGSSNRPLGVVRCSEFRWLEQKPRFSIRALKLVHHNDVRAESNYNLIYKDLWALFSFSICTNIALKHFSLLADCIKIKINLLIVWQIVIGVNH